ncbi:McrB family protein [Vibrio ezurae]|uniref:ATPase dynein-related AAA domain-containing protein n=1 Tax=Vibrio ezurae NBRC 102218 TaxID=1219080 RepID=U3B1A8_9VIBR|nr:AAA family ATPase [Vibrio ezurae]GAD79745.1 hypothetical protein VEZ01S_20_00170 [Vibrio ezurae NBRC 102218]
MTKNSIEKAIEIVKSQAYEDSQFYQFVEIEGERLPVKRFYSALFGVPYQDINTHTAERALKKEGYTITSTRPDINLPNIWKVSHGKKDISWDQSKWLDDNCLLCVHQNTKKSQGKKFISEIAVGDIVSLSRSGDVQAIVRVTSRLETMEAAPFDEGWVFRRYETIKKLASLKHYESLQLGWTPNYNGTVYQVPTAQYADFEREILMPFFDMTLAQITGIQLEENDMDSLESNENIAMKVVNTPLNQILYGPPGTGKTYHTIQASVEVAEPNFVWETRAELKAKYVELVESKRIQFVTFHQSYGYEEFVEGLSAKVTANEQINYVVKDGIFKSISRSAKENLEDSQKDQHKLDQEQKFELALDEFKQAIMETETEGFPLTDACSITYIEDNGFRYGGNWSSSSIMKFDDLKTLYLDGVTTRQEIKKNPSVSGLAKQGASYFIRALKQIQKRTPTALPESTQRQKQNYVLVIDEINRGNISKIFGELITLIEPSKRWGAEEALEVVLPHSGAKFAVPNNLHIIGTMNTADRSLAMMDTALRRRFDFKEMMPNSSLLAGKVVDDIDLQKLLEALNQRIEILYDREHTLGHAFFMGVQNFDDLVYVFQNKIIPLLAEYFFEDWEKIRLVLADNQKEKNLQFVTREEQTSDELTTLFGRNHQLDGYGEAIIKHTLAGKIAPVWSEPNAYEGIYHSISSKADIDEQTSANAEDDS